MIAPPKTNANSSTNMIDWRIAKIASSGMRGTRLRLRQLITQPSATATSPARLARLALPFLRSRSAPRPSAAAGPPRPRRPREREEDVVERRPAEADVVDRDRSLAEATHDVDELLRAALGWRSSAGACARRSWPRRRVPDQLRRRARSRGRGRRPRCARRRPAP